MKIIAFIVIFIGITKILQSLARELPEASQKQIDEAKDLLNPAFMEGLLRSILAGDGVLGVTAGLIILHLL